MNYYKLFAHFVLLPISYWILTFSFLSPHVESDEAGLKEEAGFDSMMCMMLLHESQILLETRKGRPPLVQRNQLPHSGVHQDTTQPVGPVVFGTHLPVDTEGPVLHHPGRKPVSKLPVPQANVLERAVEDVKHGMVMKMAKPDHHPFSTDAALVSDPNCENRLWHGWRGRHRRKRRRNERGVGSLKSIEKRIVRGRGTGTSPKRVGLSQIGQSIGNRILGDCLTLKSATELGQ